MTNKHTPAHKGQNFEIEGYPVTIKLEIDPSYLDENEINEGARDISYVLNGRFAGVNASCNPSTNELIISLRPLNGMGGGSAGGVVYDVDGQIFDRLHCTFVDPSNIKRIAVIPSLSAALLYGGIASGGIVIINIFLKKVKKLERK